MGFFSGNKTIVSSNGSVTITGNAQNLVIDNVNGVITINGSKVDLEPGLVSLQVNIHNDVGDVTVRGSGDVTVAGDVKGDVNTQSGDVEVSGSVSRVSTMSGDVDIVGSVSGSVSTMSGDIRHRR